VQKWEYLTVDAGGESLVTLRLDERSTGQTFEALEATTPEVVLGGYGAEGWELVAAQFVLEAERPFWKFVLKRPLQ